METFRVAEKQVSARSQEFSDTIHYRHLGYPFEIDKDVPAKDQVKGARERVVFVREIEPLKPHGLTELFCGLDSPFLWAKTLQKKFSLIVCWYVRDSLGRPNPCRSTRQNFGREIGAKNFNVPSIGSRKVGQKRHGQRKRLFAGRTGRAPNAERPAPSIGVGLSDPF